MAFHADLHIHSKYSRATSRDLDLEHLAWWAARKGIAVVGTGDCVHPVWLQEIKSKLLPDGGGLFRLKPEIENELWRTLPSACRKPVRFMLSTEISTIYKKGDKTRKVHHLIYASNLDAADRLAASLARIGNIASDGRPILGLDSRDLLEIALQSGPDSYLVPAHIWTPWFAALGSQSGFDSIEECYGDLADRIFAVETGLSSDPAMNWRISFLDRYRLTSNSDAHSPGKLGREATFFTCEPDYLAIRHALKTGEGYGGTVEFFPEEGKYHLDGHRSCGIRWEPKETVAHGGLCPVCGAPVTVGVAHRVEKLADRTETEAVPPPTAGEVKSLVPLPEILSEIVGGGVASQGVTRVYDRALAALGPELSMLEEVPVEDIARTDSLLGEAVTRLRKGAVIRQSGYDGEYGVIRLFEEGELSRFTRGDLLFDAPTRRRAGKAPTMRKAPEPQPLAEPQVQFEKSMRSGVLALLDPDQARAAEIVEGPVVVIARPGSGKTRMLTHRLAHLVLERGATASSCLAITFTRRAAEEMRERLHSLLPAAECAVHSFHSLGLLILRSHAAELGLPPGFRVAEERQRATALAAALAIAESKAAKLLKAFSLLKRTGGRPEGDLAEPFAVYQRLGKEQGWVDFDDLVGLAVELLETNPRVAAEWRERFPHISVDEFQDVDERQYRLLNLLAGPKGNICVVGDPNQAIYGFRGANASCFERFGRDFEGVRTLTLDRNYRSTGTIVTAAAAILGDDPARGIMRPMQEPIGLHVAANEWAEAEFVAATIESLIGGHDLLSANRANGGKQKAGTPLGFADFAVLYRTDAQAAALREALDRAGIPFKKSSPARISGHAAVQALFGQLAREEGPDVVARINAAAERLLREDKGIDAAGMAEARRWLTALARDGDEASLHERVALATEADFWDARADRVSLLTMHAAKGLEFAVVFVVGLEDGLIPFSWSASPGGEPDEESEKTEAEERRLLYVAMTRAKDRLFFSRVSQRFWRGQHRSLPPSRFLSRLAPALIVEHASAPRKRSAGGQQYSLFAALES